MVTDKRCDFCVAFSHSKEYRRLIYKSAYEKLFFLEDNWELVRNIVNCDWNDNYRNISYDQLPTDELRNFQKIKNEGVLVFPSLRYTFYSKDTSRSFIIEGIGNVKVIDDTTYEIRFDTWREKMKEKLIETFPEIIRGCPTCDEIVSLAHALSYNGGDERKILEIWDKKPDCKNITFTLQCCKCFNLSIRNYTKPRIEFPDCYDEITDICSKGKSSGTGSPLKNWCNTCAFKHGNFEGHCERCGSFKFGRDECFVCECDNIR